jgi:hypothetical protein
LRDCGTMHVCLLMKGWKAATMRVEPSGNARTGAAQLACGAVG